MSSTATDLEIAGHSLLTQGVGYGIVIGLGVIFAAVILTAVKVQKLYLMEDSETSEMFMMWINETVFACVQAYNYGIAAPMWWGSGLAFQIALMAVMGILTKLRVPHAHMSLEIIRKRYGPTGHFIFTTLNLINNFFGCSTMILTGSQLIVGMTGMHLAAATVLLSLGVVLYTAVGGLKATFLTDFLHTTIAIILIIYFTLSVLTHEAIGGLGGLYDKVLAAEAAGEYYIKGNYLGSAFTFKSKQSIMFAIILKFGNLALVTMDTAFWQKSFASEVHSTVPGYDLAAIAIFGIPWGVGSVIGLAARAIENTPIFPTYPGTFTPAQVGSGMVMPYVVKALIGNGGVVGILLLLFMAVTSTVSSSMIAVSSILSFDVYRSYVNRNATDKQVVRASHLGVVFHGFFITSIAMALNYGGANLTWVGYCSPVLTCPGIFPLTFTLTWSGQTKLAAIISPLLGIATGIVVWLSSAHALYWEVTIATTLKSAPALYGSIGSLFSPVLYSLIISYARPATFDWHEFLRIELVEEDISDKSSPAATPGTATLALEKPSTDSEKIDEEKSTPISITARQAPQQSLDDVEHPFDAKTLRYLRRWYKIAWAFLIFIISTTWVLWPLPLYRDYRFSKAFFGGWITVAIFFFFFWQFLALILVVIFPLWDGRKDLIKSARGIANGFRYRSQKK